VSINVRREFEAAVKPLNVVVAAEEDSTTAKNGSAVFPVGPLTSDAVTEAESKAEPKNVKVAVALVAVEVSAVVCDAVVADKVSKSWLITACDGTELSTPRPNAAAATSAMRLKFVVVDICFLSIVVSKYFLEAALR
jgi:hypothetical protein